MSKTLKKNTEERSRDISINHEYYLTGDILQAYLLRKLKNYAGYFYISLSAYGSVYKKNDEKKNIVSVTVHKYIPVLNEDGRYRSEKDIVIDVIQVNDPSFGGFVMNRKGKGYFGDVFQDVDMSKLPSIGDIEHKNPDTMDELMKFAEALLANTDVVKREPEPQTYEGDEKVEQL